MAKITLVYGAIAGAIAVGVITLGIVLGGEDGDHSGGLAFGYLIMIVALSLIFLGVKRYRDRDLGGVIKFGKALIVGVAIAAVAGAVYVAGWEAYLAATDYAFIDQYTAAVIEKKQAAGLSGAALQTEIAKLDAMKKAYAQPLLRFGMTFIEIFPVGLIIALVSAALLRNPKLLPARAR
jgi:hypothetical protein